MRPEEVTVLVTGGGGYLGTHACLELLVKNFNVIAVDNLSNCYKQEHLGQPESLIRAQILAGRKLKFYNVPITDKELGNVFEEQKQKNQKIDVVIHFAALKAVGESCAKPLLYYKNNVSGTINLLETMEKYGCKRLIYSSSATVYGIPENLPITETDLSEVAKCSNPYGKTKRMTEEIMNDLCQAASRSLENEEESERFFNSLVSFIREMRQILPFTENAMTGMNLTHKKARAAFFCEEMLKDVSKSQDWSIISLRYFNPVGAHPSGLIGEDPNGIPNNLMPFITKVAAGKIDRVVVFGNDYDTRDGTGVRDYIHVTDLIEGHVKALEKILEIDGFKVYNLGTGRGYTVLEVIKTFSEVNNVKIDYIIEGRREGDIASSYCDASLAFHELDWVATKSLQEMCADAWNFQKRNPNGYLTERSPDCLIHSPNRLRRLLTEITAVELLRAENDLKLRSLEAQDELRKREEAALVTELRRRLREMERLRNENTPLNPSPFCYDCPQIKPQTKL